MTAHAVHIFRSFAELHAHLGAMVDGEIAPIPGVPEEAYLIEDGQPRRVRACVLPEGYLEQIELANAMLRAGHEEILPAQGSQRTLVNATAARALEQGYASEAEFARAEAGALAAERAAARPAARVLPVVRREFSPSQMFEDPGELMNVKELQASIAGTMRALVSTADYDPACEIVTLKLWDGMCYMAERAKFNVVEQAELTKKDIARLVREGNDGEINIVQIERLETRLQGMRVQSFHFSQMLKVALAEREKAVAISGIDWPAYRSLADRAAVGAQAHRQKQRMKASTSHALIGMNDDQYRDWLKSHDAFYRPRRDGVDGAEGHTQPATDPS